MKIKLLLLLFLTFSFSYSQVTKEIMKEKLGSTLNIGKLEIRIPTYLKAQPTNKGDYIYSNVKLEYKDEGIVLIWSTYNESDNKTYFIPYNEIRLFYVKTREGDAKILIIYL